LERIDGSVAGPEHIAAEVPKMKIREGDWVVVCDGSKALILQNAGDGLHPNLKTREVHQQANAKTGEIGTDAPGRSSNSIGQARSAYEQTDWHGQEEGRFLAELAKRLDAAVTAGETRSILLVAPPRALGLLRQHYTQGLREALKGEIDKDFVRMPVHEIEKKLAA
jgi:protein required for attachment to host cells